MGDYRLITGTPSIINQILVLHSASSDLVTHMTPDNPKKPNKMSTSINIDDVNGPGINMWTKYEVKITVVFRIANGNNKLDSTENITWPVADLDTSVWGCEEDATFIDINKVCDTIQDCGPCGNNSCSKQPSDEAEERCRFQNMAFNITTQGIIFGFYFLGLLLVFKTINKEKSHEQQRTGSESIGMFLAMLDHIHSVCRKHMPNIFKTRNKLPTMETP